MLNLITKLYEKKYGCQPPSSPKQVASGAAPGAPSNLLSAKPAKDDEKSDVYDDDFDDLDDKKKGDKWGQKKVENAKKVEEDNWDLDDDWGDLDVIKDKKKDN